MAGRRVLLRAAALGLAATTAGSLYAVSKWTPPPPPPPLSPPTPSVKRALMESAQGLQTALHGAESLSGAHLRDVRARAEHDLALARAEGGDPAAAADLRLLLALLAARDGRTDEALRLYAEAARDSPLDHRPRALAYHLSLLAGRMDEVARWSAAYRRLVPAEIDGSDPPGLESPETSELIRELAIAAALGGVYDAAYPRQRCFLIPAACDAVDNGLVAALQDKTLPTAERLRLLALRVYLQAKVWLLVRKAERDSADAVAHEDEAAPIS